jgi:hypothetical protein
MAIEAHRITHGAIWVGHLYEISSALGNRNPIA